MSDKQTSRSVRKVIVPMLIACLCCGSTTAFCVRPNKIHAEQLRFKPGQSSIQLSRTLLVGFNDVYRFQSRAGQKMTVELTSPPNKYETPDVVFWVQTPDHYDESRVTQLLDGFDKGGETSWSGDLPITGQYEINVSFPLVSDHSIKHSIRYHLSVSIK